MRRRGRRDCIFTAAPDVLPVFSRPYTGDHIAEQRAVVQPRRLQHPDRRHATSARCRSPSHPEAHYVDLNGIQTCNSSPRARGQRRRRGGGGHRRGRAIATWSRWRPAGWQRRCRATRWRFSPVGSDPHQREVFVRHAIGCGRYSEQFTTYYAHMSDTRVRRGDAVVAGTVLGRVGTTGASGGEHLHIAVFRHRNLSYRASFELDYSRADFFELRQRSGRDRPLGLERAAGHGPVGVALPLDRQGPPRQRRQLEHPPLEAERSAHHVPGPGLTVAPGRRNATLVAIGGHPSGCPPARTQAGRCKRTRFTWRGVASTTSKRTPSTSTSSPARRICPDSCIRRPARVE